jgi:hypothetical protein
VGASNHQEVTRAIVIETLNCTTLKDSQTNQLEREELAQAHLTSGIKTSTEMMARRAEIPLTGSKRKLKRR